MWGKNPILKQEVDDGLFLKVVKGSPWSTIQGEGPYSGRRATFVRLHGCNLACTFCDTNFSDPDDPTITFEDLSAQIQELPAELVVITGGEPMRQNIVPLCRSLFVSGYTVQIETAGTLWLDTIHQYADIVVSPKTPVIHPEISRWATAFKYVIDHRMKFDRFVPITNTQGGERARLLARPRSGIPIYLSPLDYGDETINAANRKKVAELAMQYDGVIAGLQIHKFLDVP